MTNEDEIVTVYVVYNINGDVIGVANSIENAKKIYIERYGELHKSLSVHPFAMNKMQYR